MSYTFGADPELFIYNTKTDKFVSSHNLILGTKEDPFPVEYGAVQVDGVAAEFNIDPVTNFKDFKRNINEVRKQLNDMVKKHDKNLVLRAVPTAQFDQQYFDDLPSSTKVLGCDPDYCGKTGSANPRPDPGNRPFRTGGGHVHMGWGDGGYDTGSVGHFSDCRALALSLYNSGLREDSRWDSDKSRRELYGSAYSFRPKSFGMEYRYLSNAWVDDEDAMEFVFDVCQKTLSALDSGHTNVTTTVPAKYRKYREEVFYGYVTTHL